MVRNVSILGRYFCTLVKWFSTLIGYFGLNSTCKFGFASSGATFKIGNVINVIRRMPKKPAGAVVSKMT